MRDVPELNVWGVRRHFFLNPIMHRILIEYFLYFLRQIVINDHQSSYFNESAFRPPYSPNSNGTLIHVLTNVKMSNWNGLNNYFGQFFQVQATENLYRLFTCKLLNVCII